MTELEPVLQAEGSPTRSFTASDYDNDGKHHLLLAASGSVATIKIPCILKALSAHPNLSIRLVLTASAAQFLDGQSSEQPGLASFRDTYSNLESVFLDADEWAVPWRRGRSILHIELRRWAHMLLIAPLSANTLAKITGGLSDNLLTSVVRAWDTIGELSPMLLLQGNRTSKIKKRLILVAPAMNTAMWRHPITSRQISVLENDWGYFDSRPEGEENGWFQVLHPMQKELACGDIGDGAMTDWRDIVENVQRGFGLVVGNET